MADIKAIAEQLVNLTVKEVNELATVLKDEYGIEPAAAAVAVAAGPAAAGAAEAAEESFFVGADKLDELVAIKSKNELIAEVVALLQSPIKNVVSGLNAGGKVHGLLDAIAERNK